MLDADPLVSIANIRKGRWVVVNGRLYECAALWRSVGIHTTSMRLDYGSASAIVKEYWRDERCGERERYTVQQSPANSPQLFALDPLHAAVTDLGFINQVDF